MKNFSLGFAALLAIFSCTAAVSADWNWLTGGPLRPRHELSLSGQQYGILEAAVSEMTRWGLDVSRYEIEMYQLGNRHAVIFDPIVARFPDGYGPSGFDVIVGENNEIVSSSRSR